MKGSDGGWNATVDRAPHQYFLDFLTGHPMVLGGLGMQFEFTFTVMPISMAIVAVDSAIPMRSGLRRKTPEVKSTRPESGWS
jgi:hypothetical protein